MVATLDDYAAVRELVADLISDTLGSGVSPATREAVEAVRAITASEPHAYGAVAARLKLDRSSVSRRAVVAVHGGYLRNEEQRPGRAARLVLGDPLPEDVEVLPTADQLARQRGVCTRAPRSEPPPPPGSEERAMSNTTATIEALTAEVRTGDRPLLELHLAERPQLAVLLRERRQLMLVLADREQDET